MLSKSNEKSWIDHGLDDNDIFSLINEDIDENELESYSVSKSLFSPKVDSNVPSIQEPVTYPELTSLF